MFCPHCGTETHSGRKTCPNCGAQLEPPQRHKSRFLRDGGPGRLVVMIFIIAAMIGGGFAGLFALKDKTHEGHSRLDEERITAPVETATAFITTTATQTPTITMPSTSPAIGDLIQPNQRLTTVGELYEAMKRLISTGGDTINNVALTQDEMFSVLDCFGYYWEECNYTSIDAKGPYDLSFNLSVSRRAWKAWLHNDEAALDAEAGRILAKAKGVVSSLISSGMTDYEKELVLHDYIIDNCEYLIDVENRHTADARGFFDYGTCQCAGYADTFWLLGTMAGLEVSVVSGTVLDQNSDTQARYNLEDSGHDWNLVRLDGLWYGLDVTWDDPVGDKQTREYTYFNIPTSVLSKFRTWNVLTEPTGQYAQTVDDNYILLRKYNKAEYLVRDKYEAVQSAIDQFSSGGEAIIAITDKLNAMTIVDEATLDLAQHYYRTIWLTPVIGRENPIAEYLPFCIYRFGFE